MNDCACVEQNNSNKIAVSSEWKMKEAAPNKRLFQLNVMQMHSSPQSQGCTLLPLFPLVLGDRKYINKICFHAFEYD